MIRPPTITRRTVIPREMRSSTAGVGIHGTMTEARNSANAIFPPIFRADVEYGTVDFERSTYSFCSLLFSGSRRRSPQFHPSHGHCYRMPSVLSAASETVLWNRARPRDGGRARLMPTGYDCAAITRSSGAPSRRCRREK